ncbi:MAG: STAS/SEC14 domain-containing protein [Candidatus Acidiferrales bacterium]
MIERLKNLPIGIDGAKAIGTITKEHYEQVFVPLLEQARGDGRRIRFLYQFGPEFQGFTPSAAWEDAKIGLRSLHLFDGCAVVTDLAWIREVTRLAAFFMPCPVQVFGNQHFDNAVTWLQSLPEGATVSHRLLPESGVIVVEVKQPLRAQDFEALALTADAWIEAHGELQGLVIHAREFPGWENLGSFFRHLRFVRDHQRKVRKIALAVDSKLASLMPTIAEHFVQAEIKSFAYSELDSAIAWATGFSNRAAPSSRSASN